MPPRWYLEGLAATTALSLLATLPLSAFALGVHDIAATQANRPPEVRVHWVGADGMVTTEQDSAVHAHWIWDDEQNENPKLEKGGPALRIAVETTRIPMAWQLANGSGKNGSVVGLSPASSKSAGATKIRTITFDQLAGISAYDLDFETGKSHHERLSVVVTVQKAPPALLIRPKSCPQHTLTFKPIVPENLLSPRTADGRHLFIGVYCHEEYWNTEFYLVRSRDASWAYAGMPPENQPRGLLYKIETSEKNEKYEGDPVKVRTRDLDDRITEAVIHYSAEKKED